MKELNCKSGIKVVTNGKNPANISRNESDTCTAEQYEKYLTVKSTIYNGQVTVGSAYNTVTFYVNDIEPYFGGE